MRARLAMTAVLAGAAMLGSGCQQLGAILFLTSPQPIQKTEFKLTKDRLAILIDYARPADENPVFTRSLHEKLVEVFRDRKINDQVVPLGEMQERLPAWYRQRLDAPTFLLLPLQIKGRPFALIYADHAQADAIVVDDKALGLLRTLRNQAVMAFRQAA